MKKIVILVLIIVLCAVLLFGCITDGDPIEPIAPNLSLGIFRETAYPNYAEFAYICPVKHPVAQDMGLFWLRHDKGSGELIEKRASTQEGAALVDPTKPTVITIHGLQMSGGHLGVETFDVGRDIVPDFSVFGAEDSLNMNKVVLDAGYNVANFYWHRFAATSNFAAEEKIWGVNGAEGIAYRLPSGRNSLHDAFDFSVAEFFVGEYLRAANLVDGFGSAEIRIAGHSMGTPLATAATFLLTELAKTNAIKSDIIPNRLALLDGYLGWDLPQLDVAIDDFLISWSNKPHVNGNSSQSLYHCLLAINNAGIAVEFYHLINGPTPLAGTFMFARLTEVAVFVTLVPNLRTANNNFTRSLDGHNAVRLWYHASIAFPPLQNGAPSGGASTELIKELKGQRFLQTDGTTTLMPSSAVFEIEI
jgi:hypothetical protein